MEILTLSGDLSWLSFLVDVALVPTKLVVRSNGLILGLVILFRKQCGWPWHHPFQHYLLPLLLICCCQWRKCRSDKCVLRMEAFKNSCFPPQLLFGGAPSLLVSRTEKAPVACSTMLEFSSLVCLVFVATSISCLSDPMVVASPP
jgi:hypothetical protein